MWTLNRPELADALKDLSILLDKVDSLKHLEKKLEEIYKQYDRHSGALPSTYLQNITEQESDVIAKEYSNTYGNNYLSYIRKELLNNVSKCPYCSIGEPGELDHYMSKQKNKLLSVCRLNLIPACGICNKKKNDSDHQSYIHPYYQKFSENIFFLANIKIINNTITFSFHVDKNVVFDVKIQNTIENQIKKFNLDERITKQANCFLEELFVENFTDDSSLKFFLDNRLQHYETIYGKNDWRSAIVRALLQCNDFNYSVVNEYYRKKNNVVNRGA